MEKGTLIITKSKKGKFNGKIEYTKKNGKPGIFIITASIFSNDELNGKDCSFKRDKGALVELYVEEKQVYPDPKRKIQQKKDSRQNSNQKSKNAVYEELFDAEKTILPKDTKELLFNVGIDNYSLKINKAAYFNENARPKSKFEFFQASRNRKELDKFVLPNFGNINFNSFRNKFEKLNYDKKVFDLSLNWRMAVGLGYESVYETSITLHHIYGIPYISASSVKGVVRSWIITEFFGEKAVPEEEKDFSLVNAEYRAMKNDIFCKIFGCPKETKKVRFADGKPTFKDEKKKKYDFHANEKTGLGTEHLGSIIFFDAFPIEKPNIVPDVMNVHYNEYYNGDKPPTDYQNPVPIFFLTVENTKFQFIIGSKNEALDDFKIGDKTIVDWLKEALENHGIGAKTAVGYGRMK